MYIICPTFPKVIPQNDHTHGCNPLIPVLIPLKTTTLLIPLPTHRMHRLIYLRLETHPTNF